MYCSKCGKEITDDSKFCYSCGSEVEIKEKQDTVTDTPESEVDIRSIFQTQKIKSEINNQQGNDSKSSFLLKWGWGWLILIYMTYFLISRFIKDIFLHPFSTGSLLYIYGVGFLTSLIFYFWIRSFLMKKDYFLKHRKTTSCLSGVISYLLICFLGVFVVEFGIRCL